MSKTDEDIKQEMMEDLLAKYVKGMVAWSNDFTDTWDCVIKRLDGEEVALGMNTMALHFAVALLNRQCEPEELSAPDSKEEVTNMDLAFKCTLLNLLRGYKGVVEKDFDLGYLEDLRARGVI